MKQVMLRIKRGQVKILADTPEGAGTEDFTMSLAKDLGIIAERHQGYHHTHEETRQKVDVHEETL